MIIGDSHSVIVSAYNLVIICIIEQRDKKYYFENRDNSKSTPCHLLEMPERFPFRIYVKECREAIRSKKQGEERGPQLEAIFVTCKGEGEQVPEQGPDL